MVGPSTAHFIAGTVAGTCATGLLHPLDLIKIRMQVTDGLTERPVYRNTYHALVTIVRSEGPRALYQGLTPSLWGSGLSWGLYFAGYNRAKGLFAKTLHGDSLATDKLGSVEHLCAGVATGAAIMAITNPIWVVKTRMCSEVGRKPYRSLWSGIHSIYNSEGLAGLYRGFVPGLFGTLHGAVQFAVYDRLKRVWLQRPSVLRRAQERLRNPHTYRTKDGLSTVDYLFLAALSKSIAQTLTYPYQIVRARLQVQRDLGNSHYKGAADAVRKTFRNEGVLGMYKGLGPSILRVLPATCVTFVVYENISGALLYNNNM